VKIILVGCGFLGNAAADLFLKRGHRVHAICKTPAEAAVLCEEKRARENFSVEAWDVVDSSQNNNASLRSGICRAPGETPNATRETLALPVRAVGTRTGSTGVPPVVAGVSPDTRAEGEASKQAPEQREANFILTPAPDTLVFCASTRGGDAAAYRALYRDAFERLIGVFRPRQTVFVGSTSVYGQKDGEWVDETSETAPAAETARVLLEAEALATTVLRLAGLYGRDARENFEDERFFSGTTGNAENTGNSGAVENPSIPNTPSTSSLTERWRNRIHRDDAARAIVHAVENDLRGIYNVCDGAPMLLEVPCSKRGDSNKRVSNAKLRATGWKLMNYQNPCIPLKNSLS